VVAFFGRALMAPDSSTLAIGTGRGRSPWIKGELEGDLLRCRPAKALAILAALLLLVVVAGCASPDTAKVDVPGVSGAEKSAALVRAERRLFDGAPPVIPHERFGPACLSCHGERGMSVPGVGYSPPSPHGSTASMGRCEQCHVFQPGGKPWRESSFVGLRQDLRRGQRLNPLAPPVIPHRVFMRENCRACHAGPAAREEIRTSHPERPRCRSRTARSRACRRRPGPVRRRASGRSARSRSGCPP